MRSYLKRFFDVAKKLSGIDTSLFHNCDNLSWIVLINEESSEKKLGISNLGDWIIETPTNFFILDNEKSFLYAISMLEMPIELVKQRINKRFLNIMKEFEAEDIFPFYEIVSYVFNYSISDYWFNLAFQWFEKFDNVQKSRLVIVLEKLASNTKFPQKSRHMIKKEFDGSSHLNFRKYEN